MIFQSQIPIYNQKRLIFYLTNYEHLTPAFVNIICEVYFGMKYVNLEQ
jgi:hypothetical protein